MRTIELGSYSPTPNEIHEIVKVLKSGQISPGPKCEEFEEKFAATHGAKYGIFMNSGTDALRCSVAALKEKYGWKDTDQIICPATTFVATINVVLQNGLKPRLMDNNLNGFNMDRLNHFDQCGKACFDEVKAIMPVHLCGNRPDPRELLKLAKRKGWKIIEDSCESMGVGPLFGDVACYSTYVCHLLTTGVGGMAITNDRATADLIRSYANHGRDLKSARNRFIFERIGYSARATELQAVLGLDQLKDLRDIIAARQEIARMLTEGLWQFWDDLTVPLIEDTNACMMYPILSRKDNRDKLCATLEKNGIQTRLLLPILDQPCYRDAEWLDRMPGSYPCAEEYLKYGFYIPCHQAMTRKDVKHIVRVFERALDKNAK